jgi:oxygen-independent coproporphyrinogen-3 oxidase
MKSPHITDLLSKYDTPAPRYTSYPTVPYWEGTFPNPEEWLQKVVKAAEDAPEISLYIHLPFCEQLCTYCGCNKHITKNHAVESPYIQAVLTEWKLYRSQLPERVVLKELHLGGGTPTFFSPSALHSLLSSIINTVEVPEDADYGFEAHPWSATQDHLEVLFHLGFRRISIGVQDFDEYLMKVVNRRQTIHSVVECTTLARAIGYTSVNYDLIYGLPFQTTDHIRQDIQWTEVLRPDRIAFYSYAHVPWLKKSQNAYAEEDLPTGAAKRLLYEVGKEGFSALGYLNIGMDHFALPQDGLAKAFQTGSLHRNFMGYTTSKTRLLIGLGASAISDTWDGFMQNEKTVQGYQEQVAAGKLPLLKGHFLTEEDLLIRRHILNLMTQYQTSWAVTTPVLEEAVARLQELCQDGLVEISDQAVKVTMAGRPFLRTVCMAFDARYWKSQPTGQLFSKVV